LGALLRRTAIDTRPLRYADYRRIWLGSGVSAIGFAVTAVAVPVQMYAITASSLWVGLIGVAGLVPLLVFALWGGAVADVLDRRKLLLASSLLTWLVTLALLAQALAGLRSPVLLLALVAVQAVGFAVSGPTRQAIIPRLVPAGLVPAAQTLGFTAGSVATVAGPLLAGVVLGRAGGYPVAYAIDAALFTVALWATLRLPPLPPAGDDAAPRSAGLGAVLAGLWYLSTTPILALSFVIDLIAMVLAQPRALFPQVAAERFGGTGAVGWLYSAIAIGAVLGGLSSGWIGRIRRQGLALTAAVVGWGLAVAVAGACRQLWLAVALLALAGAFDLVSSVYRQTIVAVYAPDQMRGRLQGVFLAVVVGGPRLGDLRAGATAALTGPTVAWVSGGIASAVLAVLLAVAYPALRRYQGVRAPG